LCKALRLPRVNLLIADDVGLGKTIEAGLVVRELLLRRRIDLVVVAAQAAMTASPPQQVIETGSRLGQQIPRGQAGCPTRSVSAMSFAGAAPQHNRHPEGARPPGPAQKRGHLQDDHLSCGAVNMIRIKETLVCLPMGREGYHIGGQSVIAP
jgi:hypothetical protein